MGNLLQMSKSNYYLDKYLSKPIMISTDLGEKPVLIFNYSLINEHIVDSTGKINKRNKDQIKYLDIFSSMEIGFPVLDSFIIEDKKKFEEHVTEMLPQQYLSPVLATTGLVTEEYKNLTDKLGDITNLLNAMKKCVEVAQEGNDQGSLTLFGSKEPLSRIVFETITGEKIKDSLTQQDINRIGSILIDVIQSYIESDLKNPENIKKLRAEIEYKIVDALPDNLKAGDVIINLDAILQEIENFRGIDPEEQENE